MRPRRGGTPELLLAQRLLVERRRDLVALRVHRVDEGVGGRRAVELRLSEEALTDAVARVVRQIVRRESLHEVAEPLQGHRIPSLREVLRRLIVELIGVGPARRAGRRWRRPLRDLLEAAHDLVELALAPL